MKSQELFEKPNVVHLATLMPDGAPHTVPVWCRVEGDHVAFFTQPTSLKARNVARDPRVSISVADRDNPYAMASVRGRVTSTVEGDEALEIIDRISHEYTGKPFPMRTGVVYLVTVDHEWTMTLPFEDTPG
jgi:PPOX class probable F420-dependent enzyme